MTPAAQRLGIREVEYSWVAESNSLSRGSLEKAGAKRVKTYRLYDLDMSPRECRSTVITSSSAGRDDSNSEVPSGCMQTAPLFGDLATATILAPIGSEKYPVHFKLVFAGAGMRTAESVFFDYHVRENVLFPTPEGGRGCAARRLVFWLDGLGIGDAAPRAMASATARALQRTRIRPEEVQFVVPHQAGKGIVCFTEMKLEEIGLHGEVINGLTSNVGNVSSCSIPYALLYTWNRLQGTIVCPTAGVGRPGNAELSQGCIILHATETRAAVNLPSGSTGEL